MLNIKTMDLGRYRSLDAIEALTECDFDAWSMANDAGIGITSDRSLEFVVLCNGEAVGLAFVSNDGETYEFDIVVVPEHEGQGIGSHLVDVCVSDYRAAAVDENLKLETYVVNPAMEHMLSKRGFGITSIGREGSCYMKLEESLKASTRLYHVTSDDYDEFDLSCCQSQLGLHLGTLSQVEALGAELLEDGEDVFMYELDLDTSNASSVMRSIPVNSWDTASAIVAFNRSAGTDISFDIPKGDIEGTIMDELAVLGVDTLRYKNTHDGEEVEDSFIALNVGKVIAKERHYITSECDLDEFIDSRRDCEPALSLSFEAKLKGAIPVGVETATSIKALVTASKYKP
ncbi:hypothetical protein VCHA53O466_40432 [Vibrio chagasii]|nr:hypothetical protein VCHA53O466_40432 [Vibrio chagasii]